MVGLFERFALTDVLRPAPDRIFITSKSSCLYACNPIAYMHLDLGSCTLLYSLSKTGIKAGCIISLVRLPATRKLISTSISNDEWFDLFQDAHSCIRSHSGDRYHLPSLPIVPEASNPPDYAMNRSKPSPQNFPYLPR